MAAAMLVAAVSIATGIGMAVILKWTAPQTGDELLLLNEESIWWVQSVIDEPALGDSDSSPEWRSPGFDTVGWARHQGEVFGGYGYWQTDRIRSLRLRTEFGLGEVSASTRYVFSVAFRGGGVVYVNGAEIARAHMPAGEFAPGTAAEAYPAAAYLDANGTRVLPRSVRPAESDTSIYESRIRTIEVVLPADLLGDGENVVALELYHAAAPDLPAKMLSQIGEAELSWNHVGFCGATLAAHGNADAKSSTPMPQGVLAPIQANYN